MFENSVNLKYQKFTASGCKDIGTIKFTVFGKTFSRTVRIVYDTHVKWYKMCSRLYKAIIAAI